MYSAAKPEKLQEQFRQAREALRSFPEVQANAGISMPPFQIGASSTDVRFKGRSANVRYNHVTDDFKDVMRLKVVEGRWFDESDDAVNFDPVVINQQLSRELFGPESPVGKEFDPPTHPGKREKTRPRRVVGVITDFRQHGEFHVPYNYMFRRWSTAHLEGTPPGNILVRLRPGTPASFSERLMAALSPVLREKTIQIEPVSQARRSHMKLVLAPVIAGALVAVFLIIMVALGMVGVLWQHVSRRTPEIGVRRAIGGTAVYIYLQISGELLLIATGGLLLGTILVLQIPLLELMDWMTRGIFAVSLAISLAVMYLLTITSGLYPSWLATRVQPATALHYE
jgi:putative ABC transport system permease protein